MSPSGVWLRFAADHPALAGHFPQCPVVPGVLLLDAALHGIEQAQSAEAGAPAGPPWHIVTVKFHRMVRPDESLRLEYLPDSGEALRFEMRSEQELAVSGVIARGLA
ncbi:MAG: 3-hydroxyacyl-ACP dehydratase [Steroidobacteraceae bacterium]|jgi:3-hydroxymyristoyl/3-hydroxydecanoyl-(acyl carrier protein) dehydratase